MRKTFSLTLGQTGCDLLTNVVVSAEVKVTLLCSLSGGREDDIDVAFMMGRALKSFQVDSRSRTIKEHYGLIR